MNKAAYSKCSTFFNSFLFFSFLSLVFSGILWTHNSYAGDVENISAKQAEQMILGDKPVLVLDIRTPGEFEAGHLPNAVNVDFLAENFKEKIEILAAQQGDIPVILYCRTGNRSTQALGDVKKHFQGTIYHMYQGIVTWQGQLEK